MHSASASGGSRNFLEAVNFKRMGVSKGYPDITIPIPNKTHHGLYIELKRVSGSKVSEEQLWWQAQLRKNGYKSEICYGLEDAKKVILEYLSDFPIVA